MRIAFIVDQFPRLSETFILNQVTGLIDRGCEVDIFPVRRGNIPRNHPEVERYRLYERTHYPPELNPNRFLRFLRALGLVLVHGPRHPKMVMRALDILRYGKRAASLALLHTVTPYLGKGRYDIIHCHFGPSGIRGEEMRRLGAIGGRLVTTYYGIDISGHLQTYGTGVYADLLREGDRFLALSEIMKKRLIELGCDERRAMVHHLGIDSKRFTSVAHSKHPRKPARVLTIARMVEKKGLEYGLRAFAKFRESHPQAEYSIIGNGPMRDRVEEIVNELGLTECVKLLGWREQETVIDELTAADMLLVPSHTAESGDEEGTPTVILEALAAGVPVVSTRHSGIPEMLPDCYDGFLSPERDADSLAEVMIRLIENPERGTELTQLGREHVERHYDINALNDELLNIYRGLLAGAPDSPMDAKDKALRFDQDSAAPPDREMREAA